MKISFHQINQILRTLPIGYYVGRNIRVELSNEDSSYYNMTDDKIVISYPMIVNALKNIKVYGVKNSKVEVIIRTFIYHEVSHALLTPKNLIPDAIVNIVEDERIERIMDGYFLNTDFNALKRAVISNEDANDTLTSFLQFVRLGKADQEWLDKLDRLLSRYDQDAMNAKIDTDGQYWNSSPNEPNWVERDYSRSCHDLYEEWCNDHPELEQIPVRRQRNGGEDELNDRMSNVTITDGSNSSENNEGDSENSSGTGNGSGNGSQEDSCDDYSESDFEDGNGTPSDEDSDNVIIVDISDIVNESSGNGRGSGKESRPDLSGSLLNLSNFLVDQDLINEFDRIFSSHNKVVKSNSSAINSYSGVFDPRSVIREDYKYFVQRNRNGSNRAYSKVHINLFLDRSGSFSDNVVEANQIIYALNRVERMNPDFDYTLISCGDGETIEDHNNYIHQAWDGTDISSNMSKIYRQVQKKGCLNYNIVLYDGLATNRHSENRWTTFNNPETIIISDGSNQRGIENYAPRARTKFITGSYSEYLKKELVKLLSTVVR